MIEGYIKLWRSTLEDGWYQSLTDRQQLAWLHFLLTVNWAPSEYGCRRCGGYWHLPSGATAKSLETLAEHTGASIKVLRAMLAKAAKKGTIKILDRAQCHTIYVVVNWDKYQGGSKTGHDGFEKQGTERAQRGHREGTERAQEEEREEGKEGKEVPPKPPRGPALSAASQGLAKWWGDSHPWWQDHDFGARELAAWAKALDQILRMDKRTELEIRHLGGLIFGDVRDGGGFPGWARNCRTPGKLRQKKDGATYWEIISDQLSGRNRQSYQPRNGPMKGAPDTYTGPGKRT